VDYIRKSICGFNNAAKGTPFFVLADLNSDACAPARVRDWLSVQKHPNLLLRIAVREVESWILADRTGFARFLGIRVNLIPLDVESISDPKQFLISLASRSRKRAIREDLVPISSSSAIGPNYNSRLGMFVHKDWDITSAVSRSQSLQHTVHSLQTFSPAVGTAL